MSAELFSRKGLQSQSIIIDEQLQQLLIDGLSKIFSGNFDDGIFERIKPECVAIIQFIFFFLSTGCLKTTPGMKCFNLSYSRIGKRWFVCLGIFTLWFFNRLSKLSLERGWRSYPASDLRKKLNSLIRFTESFFRLLSLVNYLDFWMSGRHPILLYRLAGFKMGSLNREFGTKQAQIYIRSRDVMLQVLLTFLTALTLAFDWYGLKSYLVRQSVSVGRYLSSRTTMGRLLTSGQQATNGSRSVPGREKCSMCTKCPIESPHEADCGHLACYYCLCLAVSAQKDCPLCTSKVTQCRRWTPSH